MQREITKDGALLIPSELLCRSNITYNGPRMLDMHASLVVLHGNK